MRRCMENPAAGDGGASERRACRLDVSDNNQNRRALQCSAKVDELFWRLGEALRTGRLSDWEWDFAKSLLGQAKRGRSRWNPSAKQLAAVRRILDGLADPAENLIDGNPLIDDETEDAAA